MNQEERIDKYLNQQMDEAERARFEVEITTNSELSEAVDLQREIASFFKERAPDLEAILTEEGTQHFREAADKNGVGYWKWLLPLLIIPFGFAIWWQQQPSPTSAVISKKIPAGKEADSPFFADTFSNPPPPVLEEEIPKSSPEQPQENQGKETTKSTKKKELIASANPLDFKPNPVIESIMAEQVRAAGSITELEIPAKDATFPFTQNIPFKVLGTTNIAPPYTLSIYSNRVSDFENDYKVLFISLSGTQQNENYNFSFNAKIPFSKGLYYLLLQSEQEGEILYISRFKVE